MKANASKDHTQPEIRLHVVRKMCRSRRKLGHWGSLACGEKAYKVMPAVEIKLLPAAPVSCKQRCCGRDSKNKRLTNLRMLPISAPPEGGMSKVNEKLRRVRNLLAMLLRIYHPLKCATRKTSFTLSATTQL